MPNTNYNSSAVFSKSIKLSPEPFFAAYLAIAGLGYFRETVNGVDLHRRADLPVFLAPGWTNYKYQMSYTITDLVKTPLSTSLWCW